MLRCRFQFRLRTLFVLMLLVAVWAAVASRIAHEQELKNMILGDWVYESEPGYFHHIDFRTAISCAERVVRPDGNIDGADGVYKFNTADKTLTITWDYQDTESPKDDPLIYCGVLDNDGSLRLHPKKHVEKEFVLHRSAVRRK